VKVRTTLAGAGVLTASLLILSGCGQSKTVAALPTVTKTFTADQPPGTYEVEIENTSAHLFNLQIR